MNALVWIIGLGAIAFFGASFVWNATGVEGADVTDRVVVGSDTASPDVGSAGTSLNTLVLGESDAIAPGTLKSENYALGQVVLGGDATLLSANVEDAGPLSISSVRGEAFMEKNKKDVNVLVTWKTNKNAVSVIRYGKNGSDLSKTIEEDGYGSNHSLVLTGLDQGTTYVYVVTSKDRAGNEVSSDSYAVYTGTKTASLFDLISGAVTETFGWAMKK